MPADAPHRLVPTEVFEGFPEAEAMNMLTLTEVDGVTPLTAVVPHKSKANRDVHVESGMEAGMQQTLDRLDALPPTTHLGARRIARSIASPSPSR